MSIFKNINISDFSYYLSNEKIADYPVNVRDHSKLLVYNQGKILSDRFYNLKNYLPSSSLLIFNNTKVIQARLKFRKPTGAEIEIFCIEPYIPSDYQLSLSSTNSCMWICLIGNAKKWKSNSLSKQIKINGNVLNILVEKTEQSGKNYVLKFSWNDNNVSFGEILQQSGLMPIPPYLNRNSELIDYERYQTIYSKTDGSVAAPTAGLHFTEKVFKDLKQKNILLEELTLHVGAGTFRPVLCKKVTEHTMHTEHFFINKKLIEKLISSTGNIVSVGTTSMRALESIFFIGLKILKNKKGFHVSQFEPYSTIYDITVNDSLNAILEYMNKNNSEQITASTQIMIVPGYKFNIVDILITNFHQPKSTLLLLVSAFIGEKWKDVYQYALNNNFRFLSYGDSSLLFHDTPNTISKNFG